MESNFNIKEELIYLVLSILIFILGIYLRFTKHQYGPKNLSNWYVIFSVIIINIMNFISNIRKKRRYAIIASSILLLFCTIFLLIPQIKLLLMRIYI